MESSLPLSLSLSLSLSLQSRHYHPLLLIGPLDYIQSTEIWFMKFFIVTNLSWIHVYESIGDHCW